MSSLDDLAGLLLRLAVLVLVLLVGSRVFAVAMSRRAARQLDRIPPVSR